VLLLLLLMQAAGLFSLKLHSTTLWVSFNTLNICRLNWCGRRMQQRTAAKHWRV